MARRLAEWIKRHPIEAFFTAAIGMNFGLLVPAILKQHGILSLYLGRLGVYSPVLAGMLVTPISTNSHGKSRCWTACREPSTAAR